MMGSFLVADAVVTVVSKGSFVQTVARLLTIVGLVVNPCVLFVILVEYACHVSMECCHWYVTGTDLRRVHKELRVRAAVRALASRWVDFASGLS